MELHKIIRHDFYGEKSTKTQPQTNQCLTHDIANSKLVNKIVSDDAAAAATPSL